MDFIILVGKQLFFKDHEGVILMKLYDLIKLVNRDRKKKVKIPKDIGYLAQILWNG